jgi:DNA-binding CsgD family transcriptional regulator
MDSHRITLSTARCAAFCTGLGFTLGFGWLWFPSLQRIWLPGFLWGTYWSGGGASLFAATLLAGFFGFGILLRARSGEKNGRGGEAPPKRTIRGGFFRWPDVIHGASLVCIAAALLPAYPMAGFLPWLPALFMAAAGILQGLFWGGAMLSLSSSQAGEAFVAAALSSVLLGVLCDAVPVSTLSILLLCAVFAAWLTARGLAALRQIRAEESRRPRGRPPKTKEEVDRSRDSSLWAALAAFFAVDVGGGILAPMLADFSPWLAALLTAIGAALGCGAYILGVFSHKADEENSQRDYSQSIPFHEKLLSLVVAIFGLALFLPLSSGYLLPAGACLTEGFICVVAVGLIVQPSFVSEIQFAALLRSARILGVLLAVSILGDTVVLFLTGFRSALIPERIAGLLAFALAVAILVPHFVRLSREKSVTQNSAGTQGSAFPGLTDREIEFLRCLSADMDDKKIAECLNIKEVTVRSYVARLCRKTGNVSRTGLARLAQAQYPPQA